MIGRKNLHEAPGKLASRVRSLIPDAFNVALLSKSKSITADVEQLENLVETGQWHPALRVWREIYARYWPEKLPAKAWLKAGRAYRCQGYSKKADEILRHGAKVHPESIALKKELAEVATDRQEWAKTIKRWWAVVDSMEDAEAPANLWIKLDRAYKKRGDVEGAREALHRGLAHHPHDKDINVRLAEIAMGLEEWEEAATRWLTVIDTMEETEVPASFWIKLSRAYKEQEKLKEGKSVLQRAAVFYPDDADLNAHLAEIATGLEDWDEAVTRWRKVISHHGDEATGGMWARLVYALQRNHILKQEEIEVIARQGLEAHPGNQDIAIEWARAADRRQDWQESAKRWWEVANIYSTDVPVFVWTHLVAALRHDGKSKKAENIAGNVLDIHPDNTELGLELAEVLLEQRRWKEASSILGRIIGDVSPADLLFEQLGRHRMMRSVLSRLADIDSYKQKIEAYQHTKKEQQPKIAVYTAISGDYDPLKLPETLDPRFDFFVFTDTPVADTGVFHVRPLPYLDEDDTRSARFVKTHPHTLLRGYDIAIWIDANIMILGDMHPIVETFLESGKDIAVIPHPERYTLEEELEACIRFNKQEDRPTMAHQIETYRRDGLAEEELIESNFMIFDLTSSQVSPFLDFWWTQIENHSKRDQLSLNYALYKYGMTPHTLTSKPDSIRNHPDFALTPHKANNWPVQELVNRLGDSVADPFENPSYAEVKESHLRRYTDYSIDVIVCVHNALEDVRLCLESLKRHRRDNQQLIVVDDGSAAETARYLRTFAEENADWVTLLRNTESVGYSRAANQGIEASGGELVILLNSDIVVTADWADKMADALCSTPGAGIVGPMSSAASYQSLPSHRRDEDTQTATNELPAGITAEDMNQRCEEWSYADYFPLVPLVHGSCLGISRELINTIGGFSSDMFPRGYGEETDYCFRAIDAGFQLVIATNTYVYHAKSKSYEDSERVRLTREGSEKLRAMYGERRFRRAVRTMDFHPVLEDMRRKCKDYYKENTSR
jgi:GT2 family glycosyltransferase/tetratricopeptide (TPR) repeat protein